jgi:hypothetical protein
MEADMGQVAKWSASAFAFVVVVSIVARWCAASEECSKKHGVLVRDAAGFPVCVPEAR